MQSEGGGGEWARELFEAGFNVFDDFFGEVFRVGEVDRK